MLTWHDWLTIIPLAFVGLTLLRAFMRHSTLSPMYRVEELRGQLEELRAMNTDLRGQVAELREVAKMDRATINSLRASEAFWQEEVRRLRARKE